jgi:ABC-type branched-subunit amino acid transport system substrate-binding protein
MRTSRLAAAVAVAVTVLTVAGCGTQDTDDQAAAQQGIRLYGTDGNMSNSLGASLEDMPGKLSGMVGTAPLAPLTEDFKARLRGVEPGLTDFNYSGQSYDAVAIAALAAEVARSVNGRDIAKYVPGVTTGGVECTEVGACLALIREGRDIQYRGVSMRLGGLTDAGEPATATYGTLHFSRENKIDDGKTEYVGAGNEADTTRAEQPAPPPRSRKAPKTPLLMASLLPKSGQLAGMYPPLVSGARLAIKELNAAGGVLGHEIAWLEEDDGTNPDTAKKAAERLIAQKVNVIIGAGASGVSAPVIPVVTGAGVLMISPSATADELTSVPDNNLFFRTAAPDRLQAKALADVVLRNGGQRVFLVARDDSWGQGLLANLRGNLESAGMRPEDIGTFSYKPGDSAEDRPVLTDLSAQVKRMAPDGLVIIGFDESAFVIHELVRAKVVLHE